VTGPGLDRYREPPPPPTVFESNTANFAALLGTLVVLALFLWVVYLENR